MIKRLLISLLSLTLGLHLTGCTSDNAAQDSEESVVSSDDSFNQENSGDFEEGSAEDGSGQAASEAADGESVDDTALADGAAPADQAAAPAEGDGQETAAPTDAATPTEGAESDELALDDGADPANEFPDEVAGTDAAPVDGAAPTDPAAPADGAAPTDTAATTGEQPTDAAVFDPAAGGDQPTDQASSEPPPVDDSASADTSTADTSTESDTTEVVASEPAPKPYLPLLKIKDAPFENGGTLLNRFYVAREGDTTKSVSEKIYGSNRSKDLKKWNVLLANRPMKVGDKVYYNSPKDPADSSKMISWYEEQGVAPSTYTAQEGDDIRELSTKLLGNKNSWKELWATNMDVESKGSLPAGTELRYFPQDAGTQAVASNSTPPADIPAPTDTAATQPMDQGLPPDDPTMNPPMDDLAANTGTVAPPQDFGAPPPPPPPDMAAAPPPPPMEPMQAPPPPKPTTRAAAADEEMAGDPDQTMMLGAAGLLLLGGVLAFSVIRRKRNSKRIDMTQTQI